MGEGGQLPVLRVGEYEKELLTQAKQIRGDTSLSASEKKLILDRINKLLGSLKKFSNQDIPSPEVLSEIENFQMDMMDRAAQAMEEQNAQYEEVYGKLGELRAGVEGGEGSESTYSLTDEQRKDTLTQIDQMMHSLDLGEKPEEISKKLETLEKQLSENVIDEKTQIFMSLFTDPPVTIQELKDAGIFDEIKNNHGEMPSEKVMQFLAEHDSSLKSMISNEDAAGAMERIGGLLSEGFGIEVGIPDEETAKKYGVDKKDNLIQLGSKVYEVKISGNELSIKKTEELSEAEQAGEQVADQLANLPGIYDTTAADVLEKAKKFGVDLANLPSSPTPNLVNFLISIDKSFADKVGAFIGGCSSIPVTFGGKITLAPTNGDYAAIRDRMVEFLTVLYPNAVTRAEGGGNSSDDIIFRGEKIDIINQDNFEKAKSNPALLFDFGGNYSSGPGSDSIVDGAVYGAAGGAIGGIGTGLMMGAYFGAPLGPVGALAFGAAGAVVGGAVGAISDWLS